MNAPGDLDEQGAGDTGSAPVGPSSHPLDGPPVADAELVSGSEGSTGLPFGAWPSPLSAAMAARGGARFGGLALSRDRTGRALVWFSVLEDGRNALWVTRTDGTPRRLGSVTSARSRVNEYGGGAFWAHRESLYWVEGDDQRIRRVDLGDDDGCLVDRYQAGEGVSSQLSAAFTGAGVPLTGSTRVPRCDALRGRCCGTRRRMDGL